MKDFINKTTITVLFIFFFGYSDAQQQSIFDEMYFGEYLEIKLQSNFTNLTENRRKDISEAAQLSFEDANGEEQIWDLKVKLRGKFRRVQCAMPPLKLNFKKSDLREKGLAIFDDMKLVTHCVEDKEAAKELLLKEYLAYKLYNEISESSYRVQLVRITYKDLGTGRKTKNWGFLIEDTAQLAARMNAEKVKDFTVKETELHVEATKDVAVFQFMIGNSDWNLRSARNIKLFRKDGKVIPVPYDFDFSGLVNASYAIPNPDYDIDSVRDRVFMDLPIGFRKLHNTLYSFHGKKLKFMNLVQNFKLLSKGGRDYVKNYLNSYFEAAEDLKIAQKDILVTIDK